MIEVPRPTGTPPRVVEPDWVRPMSDLDGLTKGELDALRAMAAACEQEDR